MNQVVVVQGLRFQGLASHTTALAVVRLNEACLLDQPVITSVVP